MRILVACEESQAVTIELRRLGMKRTLATSSRVPAVILSGICKWMHWNC